MWLLPPLLLLMVSGCFSISGPWSVSGPRGGLVTIQCRYDQGWETYKKWWCRGEAWSSCEILVKTTGSEQKVQRGRVFIQDDHWRNRFTVTMEDLWWSDQDTYWCGIEKSGTDLGHQVHVFVGPAVPVTTDVAELMPTHPAVPVTTDVAELTSTHPAVPVTTDVAELMPTHPAVPVTTDVAELMPTHPAVPVTTDVAEITSTHPAVLETTDVAELTSTHPTVPETTDVAELTPTHPTAPETTPAPASLAPSPPRTPSSMALTRSLTRFLLCNMHLVLLTFIKVPLLGSLLCAAMCLNRRRGDYGGD